MTEPRVLELTEYEATRLPADEIAEPVGQLIWDRYGDKVEVEKSFKTGNDWVLTSKGWVGYLPVSPDLGISLRPKVPLGNLFRMLEYAYRLKSFEFLEGITSSGSIQEFYERLANLLAKRVLDRARRGLYRSYVPDRDELPYLRGALDIRRQLKRPWRASLPCRFEEHTADLEDNQILAWTLHCIARSGACTERVLPNVRRAYRVLQGAASLTSFTPSACIGRLYNRLNDDYQPLHALCRFFLEHAGPTHEVGQRTMLPFVVNMGRLFELFVAEWLKAHKPDHLEVRAQEKVAIGERNELHFDLDLVLYDSSSAFPLAVMDTKYKDPDARSQSDVEQIVAYAHVKGCSEACLVYPRAPRHSLDIEARGIRVRSLVFDLGGDLEEAGRQFWVDLGSTERA